MKYTCEILIELPRDEMIAKFDNPENMKFWQPGLVSFEPMSGVPGEAGAKSRLTYKMGKRTIVMVETITERALPDRFAGTYDADGMHNVVSNRFLVEGARRTRWIADQEFIMSSFMMKLIGFLAPGMFKKQTLKFMMNFKAFAEQGVHAQPD